MTIESSFRDTKSTRFEFSMNENITIKAERYTVWLLIAALASLIAWIISYAAEQKNLHYEFQANTYRHRRVLSFFYLGCQIVKKQIDVLIDLDHIRLSAWDAVAWVHYVKKTDDPSGLREQCYQSNSDGKIVIFYGSNTGANRKT